MSDPELALPDGYRDLLEDLKRSVAATRWRTQRVVNTELVALYWRLGHAILNQQKAEGWGTRVIERLAADLRAAFPEMRGLSRSNLFYMRSLAAAWPEQAIVQHPVGQLPWGHLTVLLDKLTDPAERDWYAAAALEHGWSRSLPVRSLSRPERSLSLPERRLRRHEQRDWLPRCGRPASTPTRSYCSVGLPVTSAGAHPSPADPRNGAFKARA